MIDEKEYARLRKRIKEECAQECTRRLAALDVALGKTIMAQIVEPNGHEPGKAKTMAEAVRRVIDKLPSQFNHKDLRQALTKDHAHLKFHYSTLSHFMKRLQKQGQIKIVTIGRGKIPSVYAKTDMERQLPI